jgi:adenylate cyclase
MIQDLRTKFHLEKFVSKGTAQAARSGGAGTTAQGGERREATILFSDIRGFTSYSESVSAEEVVAMLNQLLKAQTDVVHDFGGDVDKFVGDELMAVFEGEDANVRATSCALAMLDAVHRVRETDLHVGIGIATGEVVIGAIGHEDRLDFTAIGDVVNTGARLCSAAKGDEIMVTKAVQAAASASADCDFEVLEPLTVKGKKQPLDVYRVVPRLSD